MSSTSCLTRKRRRSFSGADHSFPFPADDANADADANAVSEPNQIRAADAGGDHNVNGVTLSMCDERYRRIMWGKFNLLGTMKDDVRERYAAVGALVRLKKEGACFYVKEKGGEGTLLVVNEEEALEKITNDIKRRVESSRQWLVSDGAGTQEIPSVSDYSELSGDKYTIDVDVSEKRAPIDMKTPQSSVECQEKNFDVETPLLDESFVSLSQEQSKKKEPQHKGATRKYFQDLGAGSSGRLYTEKYASKEAFYNVKRGGGSFFKMEGDASKAYVEVDEAAALRIILRDMGKLSDLDSIANQGNCANKKIHDAQLSCEPIGIIGKGTTRIPAIDLNKTELKQPSIAHQSSHQQLPCPANLPDETVAATLPHAFQQLGMNLPKDVATSDAETSATTGPSRLLPKAISSCSTVSQLTRGTPTSVVYAAPQRSDPYQLDFEEKKLDDNNTGLTSGETFKDPVIVPKTQPFVGCDVEALNAVDPFVDRCSVPSSQIRQSIDKSSKEGKLKSGQMFLEMGERRPFDVILSLNDDRYKEIMTSYFKILGKARANEKEVEAGKEILFAFKQSMGHRGKFFIQDMEYLFHDIDIPNESSNLESADIGRWMMSRRQGLNPPAVGDAKPDHNHPENNDAVGTEKNQPHLPRCQNFNSHVSLKDKDVKVSRGEGTSLRRSTRKRKPKLIESPNGDLENLEPSNGDFVLSFHNRRYEEMLGKKSLDGDCTVEDLASGIFKSLKRSFLGKGGRFVKKDPHGEFLSCVDDDEASKKIKFDLRRRNEHVQKRLKSENHSPRPEQPLFLTKEDTQSRPSQTITHEHTRQLVPSSTEVVPELTAPLCAHEAATTEHAHNATDTECTHLAGTKQIFAMDKPRSHTCPADARESCQVGTHSANVRRDDSHRMKTRGLGAGRVNTCGAQRVISSSPDTLCAVGDQCGNSLKVLQCGPLGQQLPPLGKVPTIESVHTPQQLVHFLQHATHKLNELHGTDAKHCKVLRLYFHPELNQQVKNVATDLPSLSQLAECIGITPSKLRNLFFMYQNAVMRDFNFEKYHDDRIKDHSSIFLGMDGYIQISACGENAAKDYFQEFSEKAIRDAKSSHKKNRKGDSEIETGHVTLGIGPRSNGRGSSSRRKSQRSTTVAKNDDFIVHDDKNPFLRNLERNKARLNCFNDEGKPLSLQLSHTPKRVKRGVKDRMLCMIVGCEKHAQTKCDGCCTAHFRVLSSATGTRRRVSDVDPRRKLRTKNDVEVPKSESKRVPGKQKVRGHGTRRRDSLLSKLETGSRIYVEWGDDHNLYKATVKKTFFDRNKPLVKIHYDGKKRHILDTIPLEMVKKIIDGEKKAVKKKETRGIALSLEGSQTNIISFSELLRLYPSVLPFGTSETKHACPELGSGWQVQVFSRDGLNGPCIDKMFVSPSGKKLRSVPELERHYLQYPDEFMDGMKIASLRREDGHMGVCKEISAINKNHLNSLSTIFGTKYRPSEQKESSALKSFITISPITVEGIVTNGHSSIKEPPGKGDPGAILKAPPEHKTRKANPAQQIQEYRSFSAAPFLTRSTRGKSLIGNIVKNPERVHMSSAFTPTVRIPVCHQHRLSTQIETDKGQCPPIRNASESVRRPQICIASSTLGERRGREKNGIKAIKRILKPAFRFKGRDSPPPPPKKQSKTVLCHCPECDKRNLSVQGLYAHYGRAHSGRLSWEKVTYSCPFCNLNGDSKVFNSFLDIETHVNASHQGSLVQGPHPTKIAKKPTPVARQPKQLREHVNAVPKSDRVLRERKTLPQADVIVPKEDRTEEASEIVTKVAAGDDSNPFWSKIEYVRLLPDGRKEYPRDLCRVIDMVDELRQTQEETVEAALEQRAKLCRNEAEVETRELAAERQFYQRGIRERARLADGERIEKQKFTEKAEQMMMRFYYENRNKRRNQEDIELDKLCSKPIKFSIEAQRHSARQGKACKDDHCQFCKKDKGHLHHLLLNCEIAKFNMDAPATQSPVFQQSTKVPNPSFSIVNDDFFLEANAACDKDAEKEVSGSKRVNQSRRDASTAKRLKVEEGKLWMLQNTMHCLKFVKKYNSGLISNAWGESKKECRGRKSC